MNPATEDQRSEGAQDRRHDLRLAGAGSVDAVVVDRHGQPVRVLEEARVVNVSAGGLALRTHAPVSPGSRVVVTVDGARPTHAGDRRIRLEALDPCVETGDHYLVRCRLVEGRMPARLIYRWQ